MALPKSELLFPTILPDQAAFPATSPVTLRKLTQRDERAYQEHLLRLTPHDRCNRFMGAICDDRVRAYCAGLNWSSTVVLGAFIDGELRGVGELATAARTPRLVAEIALSVEEPWQNLGVGTLLLRHILNMARNRCVSRVYLMCLLDNRKMQKIARKFDANLMAASKEVCGPIGPTTCP